MVSPASSSEAEKASALLEDWRLTYGVPRRRKALTISLSATYIVADCVLSMLTMLWRISFRLTIVVDIHLGRYSLNNERWEYSATVDNSRPTSKVLYKNLLCSHFLAIPNSRDGIISISIVIQRINECCAIILVVTVNFTYINGGQQTGNNECTKFVHKQ